MPTPTKGPRLGGGPAHERLMLANLATSLFEHDRITTTEAKAKRLRPLAERLITFAKRGDLHARRQVHDGDPRQGRGAQAVRRDRPEVRRAARRLHPDHQDQPAQGRQRPDGDHRAGRGADARLGGREAERARGTKVAAEEGADRSHRGDRRGRRGRVGDRGRGRRRRTARPGRRGDRLDGRSDEAATSSTRTRRSARGRRRPRATWPRPGSTRPTPRRRRGRRRRRRAARPAAR